MELSGNQPPPELMEMWETVKAQMKQNKKVEEISHPFTLNAIYAYAEAYIGRVDLAAKDLSSMSLKPPEKQRKKCLH